MRTRWQIVVVWVAAALAACSVKPATFMLGDGQSCQSPADCSDPACAGAPVCQPSCGNGIVDPGEQCDDGNTINGDACDTNCTAPRCGNSVVDPGEQCDDGNTTNGDSCDTNCTAPRCGNGAVDLGEQCDDGNTLNGDACEANCTLPVCGNGIKDASEQCDDGNTTNSDGCENNCTISTLAYLKASNTGASDLFGYSIALSADGSTLAVGARGEASAATGIGGNQADNSAGSAGAVYVFARSGTTWSQQAYIKASNTGAGDEFGASVALSSDGSTLAVGAYLEASAATGIGGNQADNSTRFAGAVYVFTRSGTTWSQQAYVKASNTDVGDIFGAIIALSGDGSTLAVSATEEDSAATGINGNQFDNSAGATGAVYVFTRSGTTWSQQAYVKASNIIGGFGSSAALSGDGSTMVVGATREASAARGIGGDQSDMSAPAAGAAYVFTRSGTTWSQQAYVKASNTGANDQFGWSVALAADGSTLAVGAPGEASVATGVGGNQFDNSVFFAGAVYVFTRSGATWSQQAYAKASNTGAGDGFGSSVTLSPNGSTLAVGAPSESSAATGIGGNQADNSAGGAGAAYRFTRNGTTWSQQAYVKASNTGMGDSFGWGVALSTDGTLAVGALRESSAATGIGGNQADNSASQAGAVYVLR
jgi:cysteine-rich repeat protein